MLRYADPELCPDCRATLPADPRFCPECRLPLSGPLADELFRTLLHADRLLLVEEMGVVVGRSGFSVKRTTGRAASPSWRGPISR